MINSVILGDVKFKLEFLLPLFSIFIHHSSTLQFMVTGNFVCSGSRAVMKNAVFRSAGQKGLISLVCFSELKQGSCKIWRGDITRM